jgi:signal transduction histidine kinase
MSAKSFMGEVNAIVRLAPALHLSLIGHRTSIPEKLGVSGPAARARAAMRSGWSARRWAGLAGGMACARCAAAFAQFIPLLYVNRLRLPWLVFAVAVAVTAEAWWLLRRVRARQTLRDPVLVGVDVVCCLGLIAVAAGAAELSQVFPFLFVAVGIVGFGLERSWCGVLAFGALTATWAALALPSDGLEVVPKLVSLGLWYALTLFIASESQGMAQLASAAVRSHDKLAERIREVDLTRERELAFREIHARLLPIVDAVAAGATMPGPWTTLAAREAARARRLIGDGRGGLGPRFADLLSDVRDTFAEAGMAVSAVFRIEADPPAEIGEAVAYAVREALTNVLKHADPRCEVHLFAESTGEKLEVVVRDRGPGFEPDGVAPGCGFARTYGAVRHLGGTVDVRSGPGAGTKVRILWSAAGRELAS